MTKFTWIAFHFHPRHTAQGCWKLFSTRWQAAYWVRQRDNNSRRYKRDHLILSTNDPIILYKNDCISLNKAIDHYLEYDKRRVFNS